MEVEIEPVNFALFEFESHLDQMEEAYDAMRVQFTTMSKRYLHIKKYGGDPVYLHKMRENMIRMHVAMRQMCMALRDLILEHRELMGMAEDYINWQHRIRGGQ